MYVRCLLLCRAIRTPLTSPGHTWRTRQDSSNTNKQRGWHSKKVQILRPDAVAWWQQCSELPFEHGTMVEGRRARYQGGTAVSEVPGWNGCERGTRVERLRASYQGGMAASGVPGWTGFERGTRVDQLCAGYWGGMLQALVKDRVAARSGHECRARAETLCPDRVSVRVG